MSLEDAGTQPPRLSPQEELIRQVPIPEELRVHLPMRWDFLGDVIVVRFPSELDAYEREVGETLARILRRPTIVRKISGSKGDLREPTNRMIFGDDPVTTHREHGVQYRFDVTRSMFSTGNLHEKRRIHQQVRKGERVVDLFAGIGYFTLPIAVNSGPERIVACELNPVSYGYLEANVRLNKVEDMVVTIQGDCRNVDRSLYGDWADRVLMGLIPHADPFIATALDVLRPEGGIIHFHDTCQRYRLFDESVERFTGELDRWNRGSDASFKMAEVSPRILKTYAPNVSHVVLDVTLIPSID